MSPVLPEGWFLTSADDARRLLDELQRELAPGHALSGVTLEPFADRGGARDDVLFRRLDNPARFAIVHLTWRGTTEPDPRWPSIVFEGTFEEFAEYDSRHWGLDVSTE